MNKWYPEITRLKNDRDDAIVAIESEMKKLWPLGSTVKFMRMSSQKVPSIGIVSSYDGARTRIYVTCGFFKGKSISINDIVEE